MINNEKTAIIIANSSSDYVVSNKKAEDAIIIALDGAYLLFDKYEPDIVIGDMDSIESQK